MTKLTKKQEAFCEEYLKDMNATQAAIRAGYSKKTAGSIGDENLRKPAIASFLQKVMQERSQRTKIDSDWVLLAAKRVYDRCMQDEPVLDREGKHVVCYTEQGKIAAAYTFNSSGANKALETIGKHVDVNAFGTIKTSDNESEDATPVRVIIKVEDARKNGKG